MGLSRKQERRLLQPKHVMVRRYPRRRGQPWDGWTVRAGSVATLLAAPQPATVTGTLFKRLDERGHPHAEVWE